MKQTRHENNVCDCCGSQKITIIARDDGDYDSTGHVNDGCTLAHVRGEQHDELMRRHAAKVAAGDFEEVPS